MEKEKSETIIQLNHYRLSNQSMDRDEIVQNFFTEAENLKTIIYKSYQDNKQIALNVQNEVQKGAQEITHTVSRFQSAIEKQNGVLEKKYQRLKRMNRIQNVLIAILFVLLSFVEYLHF